jgi:hypothetical protein
VCHYVENRDENKTLYAYSWPEITQTNLHIAVTFGLISIICILEKRVTLVRRWPAGNVSMETPTGQVQVICAARSIKIKEAANHPGVSRGTGKKISIANCFLKESVLAGPCYMLN